MSRSPVRIRSVAPKILRICVKKRRFRRIFSYLASQFSKSRSIDHIRAVRDCQTGGRMAQLVRMEAFYSISFAEPLKIACRRVWVHWFRAEGAPRTCQALKTNRPQAVQPAQGRFVSFSDAERIISLLSASVKTARDNRTLNSDRSVFKPKFRSSDAGDRERLRHEITAINHLISYHLISLASRCRAKLLPSVV